MTIHHRASPPERVRVAEIPGGEMSVLRSWWTSIRDRYDLTRTIIAHPRGSARVGTSPEPSGPCTNLVDDKKRPRIAWVIERHPDQSMHATKLDGKDLPWFKDGESCRRVEARQVTVRGLKGQENDPETGVGGGTHRDVQKFTPDSVPSLSGIDCDLVNDEGSAHDASRKSASTSGGELGRELDIGGSVESSYQTPLPADGQDQARDADLSLVGKRGDLQPGSRPEDAGHESPDLITKAIVTVGRFNFHTHQPTVSSRSARRRPTTPPRGAS